jgi:2-aminoadipate transaminase
MIDLIKNLAVVNRRTKSSVIRELLKLTNRPDMISLAGGLPDPAAFPLEIVEEIVIKVLRQQGRVAMQYGPTEGLEELKAEIIKQIAKEEGIHIRSENILITTASQQGLDLMGKAFIDPSDPILVELPSYVGGLQVFRSYGAEMIGVLSDNEGMILSDLENKLARLVKEEEHYKFIYTVPDFQNPSGVTMSQERREGLVRLSEKYSVFIIEDSPYRQIRFEGKAPEMLYKLGPAGNVATLFTLSKTFAPGFRLGYIIGQEHLIRKLAILKQSVDLCSSSFSQCLAAEFLKGGYFNDHVIKIKDIYRKKKDIMLQALETYMPQVDGLNWTRPEGGLFLWVRLPAYMDADKMFYEAVEQKVAYVIGSAFHCDNSGKNTMRLNFSYPTHAEIEEGIKRLAVVIKKYLRKK